MKLSLSSIRLLPFLLCICPVSLYAQRGWSSDIIIACEMSPFEKHYGSWANIQNTQGYSFGDGTFVGLVVGIKINEYDWESLYSGIRWEYQFNTCYTSRPYLGGLIGLSYHSSCNDNQNLSILASPEIGVRVGRLRLFVNYLYNNYLNSVSYTESHEVLFNSPRRSAISFGIGFRFGKK